MVLKNRKPLKLVVCMSLIVALAISALGFSVWASFENTHNNSGNQAADIVGVAQTQVGYTEGYSSYTKYGDWYGLPNSDWCAMFVSWCANQAGVDNSVFPSFALCSAGCDWFIKQGRFHYSGSYTPQAGDLIFYASYGSIYHVGLVTGSDGSNVYSIEGNYSDKVSNVSYSLSYGDILGYASPAYSTSSNSSVVVDTADSEEEEESDEEIFEDSDVTELETDTETESYIDTTDSEEDTESDVVIESDSDIEYVESETDTVSDISTDTESDIESDVAADTETDTDTAADTELSIDTDTAEETSSEIVSDTDTSVDTAVDTDSEKDDSASSMGDVNGDGSVNSLDALLVQRYLLFGNSDAKINVSKADVNGSGDVDIGDAIIILKISVHLF